MTTIDPAPPQTTAQQPAVAPPTLPFTLIASTVYGHMLVNRHDIDQANPLLKTGHAIDHREIILLIQVLQVCGGAPVFIDVGANVGTYSLAVAVAAGPQAHIHAFEPQRIIFNMLAGSVALNAHTNVWCYNVALGAREGVIELPQFDYSKPLNFSAIEFGDEQREPLHQARGRDPLKMEHVPLTTIDKFAFGRVDMIKIDVEGMELDVLEGAKETIRRCQPLIYLDVLKVDPGTLSHWLSVNGYMAYPNGVNHLCVPKDQSGRFQINYG